MAVKGTTGTVIAIDDRSPHLEVVKKLWRVNSDTLGFLPDGAFDDYAGSGTSSLSWTRLAMCGVSALPGRAGQGDDSASLRLGQ